jgi:hypothetical protein
MQDESESLLGTALLRVPCVSAAIVGRPTQGQQVVIKLPWNVSLNLRVVLVMRFLRIRFVSAEKHKQNNQNPCDGFHLPLLLRPVSTRAINPSVNTMSVVNFTGPHVGVLVFNVVFRVELKICLEHVD